MVRLEGVRIDNVPLYWPHVDGWIASAIFDFGHCWTLKDVRRDLDRGHAQLWVIWIGSDMAGCLVTQIQDTARGKTCALPVVYCDDMDAAMATVLEVIEAWAKSLSCTRLQGEGRKGWERALKPMGWKTITTQVEKVL